MRDVLLKIVIDTQIFLRAAINRRSVPGKIVFDQRDRYILYVSDDIIAEVNDVLRRPKVRERFGFTDNQIEQMLDILRSGQSVIVPEIMPVSRDPKDDMFLAVAKEVGADYLISEDRDLLVLDQYHATIIVDALAFLKLLESSQTPPTE